jgi:hypothetical protein
VAVKKEENDEAEAIRTLLDRPIKQEPNEDVDMALDTMDGEHAVKKEEEEESFDLERVAEEVSVWDG